MKKTTNSSPYQFEGRIPLSQAIPLQRVAAEL